MARDAELLAAAERGEAGGRTYSWDGPWISLGRFQSPKVDLIDPNLVPWVMRPTGGKAVLHGHDITVGMAVPLDDGEYRHLKSAYRRVIMPLVDAIRECGMPAVLGEDSRFVRPGPASADCFVGIAANDVVHDATGQKVCGCALRFTRRAVLLQASIPVHEPLVDPALVFREPHRHVAIRWEHDRFAEALQKRLELVAA